MRKVILYCSALLMAVTTSCSTQQGGSEQPKTAKIDTVRIYGKEQYASFPGKVKAVSEVDMAFKVSGTILRMYVKEGTAVRRGQILAEIDPRDYAIQLSATEAEYKQNKAEAERIMALYEKGSVTKSDYEKALYGLQQMKAKYDAHRNALGDTKMIAQFDGFIQKCYFHANETVSMGLPVLSMISSSGIEVEINIPAKNFVERDEFQSFNCTIDVYPGRTFPLEMTSITHKANLNQLYTMRLRIKDAPEGTKPTPGMSAMVNIEYKPRESSVFSIPISAMFAKDDQQSVWIYNRDDQTVSLSRIKVREILTDGTVLVSSGITSGDLIVSGGAHSLKEGMKIQPIQPVSSTNVGGLM